MHSYSCTLSTLTKLQFYAHSNNFSDDRILGDEGGVGVEGEGREGCISLRSFLRGLGDGQIFILSFWDEVGKITVILFSPVGSIFPAEGTLGN